MTQTTQQREFRADDLDDRVTRWLSFDSRTREQQAQMLTGVIERATHTPAPSTTWPLPRTPMTG